MITYINTAQQNIKFNIYDINKNLFILSLSDKSIHAANKYFKRHFFNLYLNIIKQTTTYFNMFVSHKIMPNFYNPNYMFINIINNNTKNYTAY